MGGCKRVWTESLRQAGREVATAVFEGRGRGQNPHVPPEAHVHMCTHMQTRGKSVACTGQGAKHTQPLQGALQASPTAQLGGAPL